MAFAIHEILQRKKKRIVLTRPIVEAGESLGFLPGTADEKVEAFKKAGVAVTDSPAEIGVCMKEALPSRK